jgi:DNA-binding transcriptional LysR family regulator
LAEGYSPGLVERMRSDQIDIAFIQTQVTSPEGLVADLLREEETVVALPRGHTLARSRNAGGPALSLRDLARETFIAFGSPDGAPTLQINALVAACQAAGFSPRISHVVSNNLSRLNLVAAGLGISVFSAVVQRINFEAWSFVVSGAPRNSSHRSILCRAAATLPRQFETS